MADLAGRSIEQLLDHEWIVSNGLGGFASSTVACLNTRKYHGLLVAAMSPPVRRMVLLSRLEETLHFGSRSFLLACNEYPGTFHPHGHHHLVAFRHDPHPRWAYQGDGWTIEKELQLLRGQNTVLISYTLLGTAQPVDLDLLPLLAMRGVHELSYQWNGALTVERSRAGRRVPPTRRSPEIFFAHDGDFVALRQWNLNTIYRREQQRGYSGLEDLWMPGVVRCTLSPGRTVHFACSADPIDLARVVGEADRQSSAIAAAAQKTDESLRSLSRAAESFVIDVPRGASVAVDAENCDAAVTAVIHAYPWSAPSTRAALAGIAGLFLVPGKLAQARALLLSLAGQLKGGLIPSDWPEDASPPLYRAADASLWFVRAVDRYLCYAGDDQTTFDKLLGAVEQIIESHRRGTAGLGIAADADGLLCTHEPGVATTWMDGRAGDWVITPRAGKPVELNALWYNAVCVADGLQRRRAERGAAAGGNATEYSALAASIKAAFNKRFWNESAGCCYDVIDPPDAAVRPNQLLAVSLPHAVLDSAARQAQVIETVLARLLTPLGVRTLSPDDPNYLGRYEGNVVSRERAYHQGSAFPWLLGPLISAHVRLHGRSAEARRQAAEWIAPCLAHLREYGQIPELFDGDAPHRAGGAIASALAAAELLRCQAEDILDRRPTPPVRKVADIIYVPKPIQPRAAATATRMRLS